MPRRSDAKIRAIVTAAKLFQRQGYHATGVQQIIDESGTPKGSFYFHFPKGKEQLAVAAVEMGATAVNQAIEQAVARAKGNPASLVQGIGKALSRSLEQTEHREGCPVATVALETTPGSGPLTQACHQAFSQWMDTASKGLMDCGVSRGKASELATLCIAAYEGALLLQRTEQSPRPFKTVIRFMEHLVKQVGDQENVAPQS